MKKTKNYLFAALLIPFLFALVASGFFAGCNDAETPLTNRCPNYYNCDNFKVGDTLWPDDVHGDTLIITNIGSADTLNMIFAEPFTKVITDAQIDSIFHKHCRTYYHTCKWKLCPYKGITESIFGKSVAAYVGNSESEAYSLDILHLYSPAAEYDELVDMLEND